MALGLLAGRRRRRRLHHSRVQVILDPTAIQHTMPAIPAVNLRRKLRSEEHTSELQSRQYLVCRLLLEKKQRPLAGACATATATDDRTRCDGAGGSSVDDRDMSVAAAELPVARSRDALIVDPKSTRLHS